MPLDDSFKEDWGLPALEYRLEIHGEKGLCGQANCVTVEAAERWIPVSLDLEGSEGFRQWRIIRTSDEFLVKLVVRSLASKGSVCLFEEAA